jgi:outer membrane immunogenic protein
MTKMTRKGYLLATASGVAAAAAANGGAQAADLYAKAPPPPPSWAGWYIGVNAGVNWQGAQNQIGDPKDAPNTPAVATSTTGFIGGGQIGYNWQDGNFVYGLEGDIDGLTGTAKSLNPYANFPGATGSKQFSNSIRWLSTVRARTGLAVGNTMAYVTGGLAIGGVQNSWTNTFPGACGGTTSCIKSESTTRLGWAFGGGIEHILWNSHWTVGLEGMFVDLGGSTVTNVLPASTSPHFGATTKTAHFSNQAMIGRLKLNYKF